MINKTLPIKNPRLVAVLLLLTAVSYVYGSGIDYQNAVVLNKAVGRVLLGKETTHALIAYCSHNYQQLKKDANRAIDRWRERNKNIVARSRIVQSRLANSIQQRQNGFDAEKYVLDIALAVQNGVNSFKQKLASYPPAQRRYLCKRLVLSVSAGEWDIRKKYPAAYKHINDFKL